MDPEDPAAVVNAVNALEEERAAADVAALELAAFQDRGAPADPLLMGL